jgi:hypothetical protein
MFIKFNISMLSLSFLVILLGCNKIENNVRNTNSNIKDSNDSQKQIIQKNDMNLNLLNEKRTKSGMIPFNINEKLMKSSINHNLYMDFIENITHDEINNNVFFTGETSSDRAIYVGYEHYFTGENLSYGNISIDNSIQMLFTAIYHRFGFLSFDYDEIGYDKLNTFYTYNMGNSYIKESCTENSVIPGEGFITNLCQDTSIEIGYNKFKEKIENVQTQNNSIIVYPYPNQTDVKTAFYNEFPDPLPLYEGTGNPISIQFNPYNFKDKVTIIDFELTENCTKTISDIVILNEDTDVNKHLQGNEFAFMPIKRLRYNTKYCVKATYAHMNIKDTINYSFETEKITSEIYYSELKTNTISINPNSKEFVIVLDRNFNLNPLPKNELSITKNYEFEFYDYDTFIFRTNNRFEPFDFYINDIIISIK